MRKCRHKLQSTVATATVLAVGLGVTGCLDDVPESSISATNEMDGSTFKHWFEAFEVKESGDDAFVQYHRDRKEILMGNRYPNLKDNLKGVFYLDGNPLPSKTLSISAAKEGDGWLYDYSFAIEEPSLFSVFHDTETHTGFDNQPDRDIRYEMSFKDCPPEVVQQREEMWGMADGSCTAEDQEYMVFVPSIKQGPFRFRIPSSLFLFEMYLRPQNNDDFLTWERRSKPSALVKLFMGKDADHQLEEDGYHHYSFRQIMDKEGNPLSSYAKFAQDLSSLAEQEGLGSGPQIYFLCYEGPDGCSVERVTEGHQLATEVKEYSPRFHLNATIEQLKELLKRAKNGWSAILGHGL